MNCFVGTTSILVSNIFCDCFLAVGCSDLVPPSDAWLKRTDNVATVGCYMTRQTWILTCDHNGRWTGTFGNCTQRTATLTYSTLHRKNVD